MKTFAWNKCGMVEFDECCGFEPYVTHEEAQAAITTLQADNERLRKENEELKNELFECSAVIDSIEPLNRAFEKMYSKLTAERDELLAAVQDIYHNYHDQPFVYTTARDVFIKYAKKAKHEGEKHD